MRFEKNSKTLASHADYSWTAARPRAAARLRDEIGRFSAWRCAGARPRAKIARFMAWPRAGVRPLASLASQYFLLFLSIDKNDMNHKRIYAIFAAILLACTAVSSCITLTVASVASSAVYALATRNTRIKGNTTRQVNENAAVLITNKGEEVCIVYSFDGKYKNGMKINAKFRLGGVYEYSDSVGDVHRIPIYVYSREIEKLAPTAMELDIRYKKQDDGATYQI